MIPQVGGFQGCYLDNHRNNWRCARAVRKRPLCRAFQVVSLVLSCVSVVQGCRPLCVEQEQRKLVFEKCTELNAAISKAQEERAKALETRKQELGLRAQLLKSTGQTLQSQEEALANGKDQVLLTC